MSATPPVHRETWSGRSAFIIAAVSSAIGLGNIWRFPGVAYENGGGAFLLPYLIAFVTAGLPILFLDYAIGHRYRASAPLAFRRINRRFEPLGWWQVGLCYVICIYYAVVIAWALAYAVYAVTLAWGEDAVDFFLSEHLRRPETVGFTFDFAPAVLIPLVLVWLTAVVALALGIRRGIDRVNRVTLPLLAVSFTAIVVYALFLPGAVDGLNAFFTPSWAALADPAVWIAAYGHIFFSFSIAFGIMLTYSSYLRRKSDLTGSGLVVAFSNTSFELLAGIGVFATLGFLASAQGSTIDELESIQGVGLAFMTYPTLLSQMPGGQIIGVLFFVALVLAGFSSLLSILQVQSSAVQDKTGWSTRRAGVALGIATAVPSILLFATSSGLYTLDVVDAFVNNIGVVLSAILTLLLVVIVGRKGPELARHLNAVSSLRVGPLWRVMVTVVTPVILTVILITGAYGYIVDGYGGLPTWFLGVAGWGVLAVLAVLSGVLSLGTYRRPGALTTEPDDTEQLAREVQADRQRALQQRDERKASR
ncbi:sodium-dependent transporter [Microbacterium sp. zg-Y818]|uniref:sodium-dependent transporter n=1 Tax=unclassified Microbacterium TaxID=2609290 RepID=UPI00214B4F82|nr:MULTISPECIES: sodium-dependent transporter [unclassified Microbacterium]MCR2799625.1 sodium-dependent transporter [Microbacterium sp. zg.Y818]WIM21616.1 sodium-dependent transporter [Microbacterium sp. zg-Y818]